jgi:transcriptional regulator CBF1
MAMQNKRKREIHDMAGGRAAPGIAQNDEFAQHYLADDNVDATDDVMNFAAAFSQHTADPNNAANQVGVDGTGQSASDTAAAAMAQYHTMTVPQSTEQSFMTQPEGDKQSSIDQSTSNPQQRQSSFGDFDTGAIRSSPPNGDTSPTSAIPGMSGPKPPVGSEEWHKVRKDNHKEGEVDPNHNFPLHQLTPWQSSVAAAKPSTKASTS